MDKNIKQIIVCRHDLGMRRGKQIAQGSHASMIFLTKRIKDTYPNFNDIKFSEVEKSWLFGSFKKVCVRCNSEQELNELYYAAKNAGLETNMVIDSGATEFHGVATATCIAIGPDLDEKIDPITGHLVLL